MGFRSTRRQNKAAGACRGCIQGASEAWSSSTGRGPATDASVGASRASEMDLQRSGALVTRGTDRGANQPRLRREHDSRRSHKHAEASTRLGDIRSGD